MLSILIPTYNYNIFPLVAELHKQCTANYIPFEIIVIDDASQEFHSENSRTNLLDNASYSVLEKNIGRSRIRNLLAKKAQFQWLLFLDADVMPKEDNFIATYIGQARDPHILINGGILYSEKAPETSKLLRWVYGSKREALPKEKRDENPYRSFLSLNFMVSKPLFETIPFDESLPNLRHEDTVFSYNLQKKGARIRHINNPVYHFGLDSFHVAIRKEEESVMALRYLLENQIIAADYVKIGNYYSKIRKLGLLNAVASLHKIMKPLMLKNLSGKSPSLFICDIYRLGYMCGLKSSFKRPE